ncbi:hypothetical protein [Rubritalea tangerina]
MTSALIDRAASGLILFLITNSYIINGVGLRATLHNCPSIDS